MWFTDCTQGRSWITQGRSMTRNRRTDHAALTSHAHAARNHAATDHPATPPETITATAGRAVGCPSGSFGPRRSPGESRERTRNRPEAITRPNARRITRRHGSRRRRQDKRSLCRVCAAFFCLFLQVCARACKGGVFASLCFARSCEFVQKFARQAFTIRNPLLCPAELPG